MQRAFTMIELIYVIVVIGILAAVAIPRLNVTRDDATISSLIAQTRTLIGDIKSYYNAQGNPNWRIAKMVDVTDIGLYTDATCTTPVIDITEATPGIFHLCDKSSNNIVNVVMFETTDEGNLTVTTNGGSAIADAVASDISMKAMANGVSVGKEYIIGGIKIHRN